LAVPSLCELYPGICLITEEKAQKNLSQDSRRDSKREDFLKKIRKVNRKLVIWGGGEGV
jgi:hypothetical protein